MANQTSYWDQTKPLRDRNTAVAIAKSYAELALYAGMAAQRARVHLTEPAQIVEELHKQNLIAPEAFTLFQELVRVYETVVAHEAEPTPDDARRFDHYAEAVGIALNRV
jgi:hypothetical protein